MASTDSLRFWTRRSQALARKLQAQIDAEQELDPDTVTAWENVWGLIQETQAGRFQSTSAA